MNFRMNLAVACAAAFSFACAEKPASPTLIETAAAAHPGQRLIGLYSMTVTPVEGSDGRLFAFEPIPVGRDGSPDTNPRGTVQVGGTFGAITNGVSGSCAGVPTISAPVRITNFALDPLTNVWVDIVSMPGHTGNTACNSTPSSQSGGMYAVADMTQGIWKYNNLAGATALNGSVAGGTAGGTSLPLAGSWQLRTSAGTGFVFFFEIWAENGAPVMDGVDPAGPAAPLTWSSTAAASSNLELCAVDPGANFQAACPAGQSIAVTGNPQLGLGAGPWTFSYAPVGLVNGQTYWYRATNVFAAGAGAFHSQWAPFTFNGTAPVTTPVTVLANAIAADVSWTTAPQVTSSYYFLCNGACPNPLPAAAAVNQQNVVLQGALVDPAPTTSSFYTLDIIAGLQTSVDAVSGAYINPATTWQMLVYNYDGVNAPTNPSLGTPLAITVTGVQVVPTLSEPASYLAGAATWPVTWTTDTQFIDSMLDVCVPDCATDVAPVTVVVPVTVGTPGSFSYDLKLATGAIAANGTFEFYVYNTDLYQVPTAAAGGIRTVQ